MSKGYRVSVRIPDQLGADFQDSLKTTGLGETQFITQAIEAFVQQVREKGEITLPLAIVPKSSLKKTGGDTRLIVPPEAEKSQRLNEGDSTPGPRARSAKAAIAKLVSKERKT